MENGAQSAHPRPTVIGGAGATMPFESAADRLVDPTRDITRRQSNPEVDSVDPLARKLSVSEATAPVSVSKPTMPHVRRAHTAPVHEDKNACIFRRLRERLDAEEDAAALAAAASANPGGSVPAEAVAEYTGRPADARHHDARDGPGLSPKLALQRGDVVSVTDFSQRMWWRGKCQGRDGWFPAANVRVSRDPAVAPPPAPAPGTPLPVTPFAATPFAVTPSARTPTAAHTTSYFSSEGVDPLAVDVAGPLSPTTPAPSMFGGANSLFGSDAAGSSISTISLNHGDHMHLRESRKNSVFSAASDLSTSTSDTPFSVDMLSDSAGLSAAVAAAAAVARKASRRHGKPTTPFAERWLDSQLPEDSASASTSSTAGAGQLEGMPGLWADIVKNLSVPSYDDWDEAEQKTLELIAATQNSENINVTEVTQHVQALGEIAGVLRGSAVQFSFGSIINATIMLYVEMARGSSLAPQLEALATQIRHFGDIYRHTVDDTRSIGEEPNDGLYSYIFDDATPSSSRKSSLDLTGLARNFRNSVISMASADSAADGSMGLDPRSAAEVDAETSDTLSALGRSARSGSVANIEPDAAHAKYYMTANIVNEIIAQKQLLLRSMDLSNKDNWCHTSNTESMCLSGIYCIASLLKSILTLIDAIDIRPFFAKGCHGEAVQRDSYILEYLRQFLVSRGTVYDLLATMADRKLSTTSLLDAGAPAFVRDQGPGLTAALDSLVDAITALRHYSGTLPDALPEQLPQVEVVYSNSGAIRGATKRGLVQQITLHDKRRSDLTAGFLTTFPAFMSHLEVIDLLIERFQSKSTSGAAPEQQAGWERRVMSPVRLRVLNVLKQWLSTYWAPPIRFEDLSEFWIRLTTFVDELVADGFPGAQVLASLVNKRRAGNLDLAARRVSVEQSPDSIPFLRAQVEGVPVGLDDVDPVELARQMTLAKERKYRDLTREDLIARFTIKNAPSSTVSDYVAYWNRETNWTSHRILQEEDAAARAKVVAYFIRVASALHMLKNFSSLMAILSALNSAGIYRLRKTWALVPKQQQETLGRLLQVMSSTRNFRAYREQLSMINDCALPFFGVTLMDLQFAVEGNPDMLDAEHGLINFAKWMTVSRIIGDVLRFQFMSFRLREVPPVQGMLRREILAAPPLADQYDRSLEREPRERRLPLVPLSS